MVSFSKKLSVKRGKKKRKINIDKTKRQKKKNNDKRNKKLSIWYHCLYFCGSYPIPSPESLSAPSLINRSYRHVSSPSGFFPTTLPKPQSSCKSRGTFSFSVRTCPLSTMHHSQSLPLWDTFFSCVPTQYTPPTSLSVLFLDSFHWLLIFCSTYKCQSTQVLSWLAFSSLPTHSPYMIASSPMVLGAISKQMTPKFVSLMMTSACKPQLL